MIKGLKNTGNICYLNSIIQIINNLDIKTNYKYTPNKQFKLHQQNDQHDFLLFLLDYINENSYKAYKIPSMPNYMSKIQKKALYNLYTYGLVIQKGQKESIYISDIFNFIGQRIIRTKCQECSNIKINFDVFKTLELNIPINLSSPNLYDCLDYNYSCLNKISDYYCKKCKKNTEAIQTTMLWRAPKILSILLIRNIWINNISYKNNTNINFPENIELNKYIANNLDDKLKYSLNSVAYHFGNPNSGHCISYCKSKSQNNVWYICDDENITQTNTYNTENAYILFYVKT